MADSFVDESRYGLVGGAKWNRTGKGLEFDD